jgi:hypothetical protein
MIGRIIYRRAFSLTWTALWGTSFKWREQQGMQIHAGFVKYLIKRTYRIVNVEVISHIT